MRKQNQHVGTVGKYVEFVFLGWHWSFCISFYFRIYFPLFFRSPCLLDLDSKEEETPKSQRWCWAAVVPTHRNSAIAMRVPTCVVCAEVANSHTEGERIIYYRISFSVFWRKYFLGTFQHRLAFKYLISGLPKSVFHMLTYIAGIFLRIFFWFGKN